MKKIAVYAKFFLLNDLKFLIKKLIRILCWLCNKLLKMPLMTWIGERCSFVIKELPKI